MSTKTVFVNGCFDILHVGHTRLLEFAKSRGDVLIVGLNSDKSVRELKGDTRPINDELKRREMLRAIRWINEVIIFDDLEECLELVKPDLIVRGPDHSSKHPKYTIEFYLETTKLDSTSELIARIASNGSDQ